MAQRLRTAAQILKFIEKLVADNEDIPATKLQALAQLCRVALDAQQRADIEAQIRRLQIGSLPPIIHEEDVEVSQEIKPDAATG